MGSPSPEFRVGQRVEFLSGSGKWKPGVVDYLYRLNGRVRGKIRNVRIRVGPKVCVVRPTTKCRLAEGET